MTNTTPARITDIIHFHGLTLMVYTNDGVQYIAAKPLSDLAGMDWRTTKRTIIESENAVLYGSTQLNPAENVSEGGDTCVKDSAQPVVKKNCGHMPKIRVWSTVAA